MSVIANINKLVGSNIGESLNIMVHGLVDRKPYVISQLHESGSLYRYRSVGQQ